MKAKELPAVGQGCEPYHKWTGHKNKQLLGICKEHPSLMISECVVCGCLFHTKRRHTETCSDKCRKAQSRRKKHTMVRRVIKIKTKAGIVEQEVMW